MIKKTLLVLSSTLLGASIASAAWEMVDDFEGYADQAALEAVWFVDADPDGEGGGISVIADPEDAGNKVMQHTAGATTAESGSYNHRAWRSLPAVSAGTATVYLRFAVPNVVIDGTELAGVVDEVWGITPVDEPTAYGDYSMLSRQEFDFSLDVYNTDGYVLMTDNLPGNTWYEWWYSFDHDTRTFDAYIMGGTLYPTMTKLNTDAFGYRNATIEPLDTFLLTMSAGTVLVPKALDAAIIDDIYIDTAGENLTSAAGGGGPVVGVSGTKLINISTRGEVGTGDKILIAGFVISGEAPQEVLIRASGQTLGELGVPGVLADTVLTLIPAGGGDPIATNTNWGDADNAADIGTAADTVGAFAFTAGSTDSAILMTLDPGGYTAQVSGADNATGVALVEVYAVD